MIKKNIPGSVILKTIIYTNVCFFIISLLISWGSIKFSLHPLTALTPSTKSLVLLGASGVIHINNYN